MARLQDRQPRAGARIAQVDSRKRLTVTEMTAGGLTVALWWVVRSDGRIDGPYLSPQTIDKASGERLLCVPADDWTGQVAAWSVFRRVASSRLSAVADRLTPGQEV